MGKAKATPERRVVERSAGDVAVAVAVAGAGRCRVPVIGDGNFGDN